MHNLSVGLDVLKCTLRSDRDTFFTESMFSPQGVTRRWETLPCCQRPESLFCLINGSCMISPRDWLS
jgi:hypothetical protein